MHQEWLDADESLVDVLRRAGFRRRHAQGLTGFVVSIALALGITFLAPPAAYAETVPPASSAESTTPADGTSTDGTTTDGVTTDGTSTDGTTTDGATTDGTTSDGATSDATTLTPSTTSTVTTATSSPAIQSVNIEGDARVRSTLTAVVVATGSPEPSIEYQWQRAGLSSGPYVDIDGATGETYVPVEDDLGAYIRVKVIASNDAGDSDPAYSDPTNSIRGAVLSAQALSIASVSPSSGPAAGGNSVTITGTDFLLVNRVRFDASNALSFTIESSTQIVAVAPPGTPGLIVPRVVRSLSRLTRTSRL